ncbi:TetR/AcrR family transcriptional regulator [Aureimonas altamirensis]|uniref:TetR/AcrR family transcriptional regulator n=1 Tax=Aureimonas altamirensis TaxID=370622 RepID=UPI001E349CF2|nr:TetR/AcrR family transcriptional regulator [Aureimonas altamirensis]UHD45248.1 TetR/AcrR family transcriptional regulator [Aureimonas altamirensis]
MTMQDIDSSDAAPDVRSRILVAASRLIAEGGSEAATTRAVAASAGVQAPTIYRFFGDKRGLLSAVAEHELARYVAHKGSQAPHPDPVEDLRLGWDAHLAFCLANPGLFAILVGDTVETGASAAALRGQEVLRRRIQRIAQSGRLTTSEDRALAAVHSAATGAVLALLQQPEAERDAGLSSFARDMVIAAISRTSGTPAPEDARRPQSAAAELRTALDAISVLSDGERHLLGELLDRIATAE